MDRLDKTYKAGDILRASDLNLHVDKINELVDALNGSSTVQRKVIIQNNMDSKAIAAQKGQPCILDFTFVSQERYSYDEPFENTGERGLCQVFVKNAENESYTSVKEYFINSNVSTKLDVAGYLTSGANSIMLKVVGEVTGEVTPAYSYTIQLTSLSLAAPNFKWWTTFYNHIVVPFQVGGNINKTLFVEITGADGFYNERYSVNLGTSIYTETAYNFTIPHPNQAGVFHLKAYLTNSDGTIRTQAVEFNIMCSMSLDISSFIAINNVASEATNWVENALFDYSLTDAGAATTSVTFTVKKDGKQVYQSIESAVTTNTKHTFTYPMEIETDTDEGFTITVEVTNVNGALAEPLTFTVNNSLGFSATAGAVFYMNPRTRSNSQANREKVINEVDASEVDATWHGMNWGNDGWEKDADGNKVLRVLAGSSLDIAYQPFAVESARKGKTIEIDFKPDCVTEFNHPILKIATAAGEKFVGLQIYPDDVVMYSQALKNKDNQSISIYEGKRTRLTLVIMPNAYSNQGFNLCIVYINGVKNREFTYENNDYFAQNSDIIIGSDYADIDVHGIRVYDSALTSSGVSRNMINWLPTKEDKEAAKEQNDVMDVNGSEIDYEKVKAKYNTFVIGSPIPSLSNPNTLNTFLRTSFAEHPEWNWHIDTIPVGGQGTSSMRYWRWNLRGKMGKTCTATYADGSTTTGYVNFIPTLKKVKKLTAKKNFASSMQSHKMGSVNSIDDLAREMGIIEADSPRIATYQMPFVGFSMSVNEEGEEVYTFIGLYTFGPDKGDDATFGYDTDKYPELLSIEGSDNAPLFTLFRVPWDPNRTNVAYNPGEEALQYNNANSWDYDAGKPDSEDEPEAVFALAKKLWMPSYNMVYECSPRILPFAGDAAALNAQASVLRKSGMDYWLPNGDLYYFESSENRFIQAKTHNGEINLYTQLVDKGYGLTTADLEGKTADELNALFIKARVEKFRKEAQSKGHLDVKNLIFALCWVVFNAATDNLAKNTYPYIFGDPEFGYLWRMRHDDLDTIWSIINQGLSKKGYGVEIGDKYENGGAIWNGETSNLWALLRMAFPEEIEETMRSMMAAMEKLGGLTTGSTFDKIYAFFDKYYFKQAQEYFCANLYNADAKWAYEEAKLAYMDGRYTNDTDPITQSLGDHYEAEQRWIRKRILYMMSKYSYGLFSADGTDNITVRAAGDKITYELTPAMDMYPAIANGTSIIRGARTKAGEKCTIEVELGGTGDQQNTIQAASYLQDIGEWHDKNVTGSMIIRGRMLRKIKLGDATADIIISITGLTLADCASLQELDVRRITTLSGVLNLAACYHLKKVYAGGTSVVQIVLPEGGGLELVQYNALSQYLILKNYPLLTNEGIIIDECKEVITDFLISNCVKVNPMQLLISIMDAQSSQGAGHALKRIRAVGFNETFSDGTLLDKLTSLTDGSYVGLDSEGLAGEDPYPVLDGTVNVSTSAYEDTVLSLQYFFPNLELNILGEWFVRFEDPEVLRICLENWDTNHDGGLTKSELAAISSIGTIFKENTKITSFDEFQYFTGVTSLNADAFHKSSIHEITLPDGITNIPNGYFNNQYSLGVFAFSEIQKVVLPHSLTSIGVCSFYSCKNLAKINLESVIAIERGAFDSCSFEELNLNDNCILKNGAISNCNNLKRLVIPEGNTNLGIVQGCKGMEYLEYPEGGTTVDSYGSSNSGILVLPSTVTTIKDMAFARSAYSFIVLKAKTPPTLGSNPFYSGSWPTYIYVPDNSVEAYKVATNWNNLSNRIRPLSEFTE